MSKKQEQRKQIFYLGCAVLVLCFCLQDASVSVDIAEYMKQYEIVPTLDFVKLLDHKFEIGFNVICVALSAVTQSNRMLVVVVSLLSLVPFFIWFVRESEDPMTALMAFLALGIYYHSLIFYRQLCAMAVMTFAWKYVRERKWLPFVLLLLLATSFHKTVAVLGVVYFVYMLPVNWFLIAIGLIASALIGLFCKPIIAFISRHFFVYPDFYMVADGGLTMMIVLWVFVLLAYWLLKERLQEPKIKLLFLMVLVAAVIHPVVFAFYNWCRIVLYFRVAMIMLVPELVKAVAGKEPENKILGIVRLLLPAVYEPVRKLYSMPWFPTAVRAILFAILFVWYDSELCGAVYRMVPV